jgi:ribosomal protein L7/L12
MDNISDRLNALENRIEEIENKMTFLYRKLGIDDSNNTLDAEKRSEIIQLINKGKTKAAIKEFKNVTGASLKEAKQAIEEIKKH